MMKQLVFIDDSGDPGFIKGANSSYLIMAGVVFVDSGEAARVNEEISVFRKTLGLKDDYEFKFRKNSKIVKTQFLERINKYNFEVYAVYIDKTKYPRSFQFSNHEKLYNWTVKELLKIIPMNEALVKIDGSLNRKYGLKVGSNIRKEINSDVHKIKKVVHQDSVSDNLIQLADMLVGSIHRSFQAEKTDAQIYLRIFKHKLKVLKLLDLN